MSLLSTIKADQLAARKAQDRLKGTLLTTLIGEAEMVGKNDGNRETTDVEVIAVIKKFISNAKATLDALGPIEGGPVMLPMAEIRILDGYLPKQLTVEQLMGIASGMILSGAVPKDIKSKGIIMKNLKDTYAGQYDGKDAATAVDTVLKA